MPKATNWESLPLLLTVPELKEAIGLSKHRAYALASVIGIKIGKRLLVPKDALRTWLDKSARQGGGDGR